MGKDEKKEKMNKEEFEKLQEELNSLKGLADKLDNQLKRAVADYQNLEKRVSEGRSELTSFVASELVKKLLPVLDHLEQALGGLSEQEKQSGWAKGVELAVKEFKQVLAQEGLDEIVADGQFDPSLHEAVDTREGDDNIILEVVRKGYQLNNRVVRPVQVVVGKKNPPTKEETENLAGGETQSDFHIPSEGEAEEEK